MTLASDDKRDTDGLSATTLRMLALREVVFEEWTNRVRASSKKAETLPQPILVDTMPAFYDNIAESLTADYPRTQGVDGTNLAAEHGNERARVTAYDHETLIGEYQLFRWVVFEVLYREGVELSAAQVLTINASIDAGIKEAVSAFALVHTLLREKFAAALTHDLRGPLGAASTALELILINNDPAMLRVFAVKALQNVQRMDGMIRELLDSMAFHGGEQIPLRMSQFDILEVVKEVQVDTAGIQGARIEIAGVSVIGWWDRSSLRRALENLVSNAIKYGHESRPITIRVQESHGRLILHVHNEGTPIPPDEQQAIFQMYRRTESAQLTQRQGWGIGLPYVRAVAESHGGSVVTDSTPERGTTFTIEVPVDCRPYDGSPTIV